MLIISSQLNEIYRCVRLTPFATHNIHSSRNFLLIDEYIRSSEIGSESVKGAT